MNSNEAYRFTQTVIDTKADEITLSELEELKQQNKARIEKIEETYNLKKEVEKTFKERVLE